MSESQQPQTLEGRLVGFRTKARAVAGLMEISRLRSEGHVAANLFRDLHLQQSGDGVRVEQELRQGMATARGILARWGCWLRTRSFGRLTWRALRMQGRGRRPAKLKRTLGDWHFNFLWTKSVMAS